MTEQSLALMVNLLIAENTNASLATIMSDDNSNPFASWVPYCQSYDGTLIVLLSDLAQHTKNIKENSNGSLLINSKQVNPAADMPRISIQVQITPIEENSQLIERYYRYYAEAKDYFINLDFHFYQAAPKKLQAIAGFGQVRWFGSEVVQPSPFSQGDELHMIEHMNDDHVDAIRHYCDKVSIHCAPECIPKIVGISAYGFHVRVDTELHWFAFATPSHSVQKVREALVSMARS